MDWALVGMIALLAIIVSLIGRALKRNEEINDQFKEDEKNLHVKHIEKMNK